MPIYLTCGSQDDDLTKLQATYNNRFFCIAHWRTDLLFEASGTFLASGASSERASGSKPNGKDQAFGVCHGRNNFTSSGFAHLLFWKPRIRGALY